MMWLNSVRVVACALLWLLLFRVSRANHPTFTLDAAATTAMMFASLAALGIIVQIFRRSSAIIRFGGAALCVVAGGVLAALAISATYDIEVGPDPRRFGLAANIAMDTVVVAILAALMGALDWCLRRAVLKSPRLTRSI